MCSLYKFCLKYHCLFLRFSKTKIKYLSIFWWSEQEKRFEKKYIKNTKNDDLSLSTPFRLDFFRTILYYYNIGVEHTYKVWYSSHSFSSLPFVPATSNIRHLSPTCATRAQFRTDFHRVIWFVLFVPCWFCKLFCCPSFDRKHLIPLFFFGFSHGFTVFSRVFFEFIFVALFGSIYSSVFLFIVLV